MKNAFFSKSDPADIPAFAGCIVRTEDGKILCQLRDNKPEIRSPGLWTCTPGGHLRHGEAPRRAIRRELFEEFEIRVKNLKFLELVEEDPYHAGGKYYFFSGVLSSPEERTQCHEGQKAVFFSPVKALKLKQHPLSLRMLKACLLRDNKSGKRTSLN